MLPVFALLIMLPLGVMGQSGPCPRFAAGSDVTAPADLYSQNGTLTVSLSYNTSIDAAGRTLYCFTTPDGKQSPTLHVHPGDHLIVQVKNNLPAPAALDSMRMSTNASRVCGAPLMDASSVNVHYHGSNTAPTCHSDEVIYTLINAGETFTYNLAFPEDEPSGLYWYHPHVHGISEAAVQGGASGAIIVEGIENLQPAVAGVPQRLLIVRDQEVAGSPEGDDVPAWDLTLNHVPIAYPVLTPAVIRAASGQTEFWRVVNASADTILDLELNYDDVPQTMRLVGLDGVALGSQDGAHAGTPLSVKHYRLPPAGRAEFLIQMPSANVRKAQFLTRAVDTGADGDNDTLRVMANIVGGVAARGTMAAPGVSLPVIRQRFAGLATAAVTTRRRLYFSENDTEFFITVQGDTPKAFSPDNPPAIVTTQGSVEEWIIENRSQENHEFHMHQVHFLVASQNHFEVNGSEPIAILQGQLLDTIDIPHWDGNPAHPYPSVTLRLDFRGPDVGDFVYHCHILEHEDKGMMAIIRVVQRRPPVGGRPKRW
jgi:FtsP/CotA-like multicopper oxidase with cupredoxin domain